MPRCRPAPLADHEVAVVVVKNTFLEVSFAKSAWSQDSQLPVECGGLATAPASLVGAIRRSLSEPRHFLQTVATLRGSPMKMRFGALCATSSDCADTATTVASTPRGLDSSFIKEEEDAATPLGMVGAGLEGEGALAWPSTPATPGAPVQISLAELTGDDVDIAAQIVGGGGEASLGEHVPLHFVPMMPGTYPEMLYEPQQLQFDPSWEEAMWHEQYCIGYQTMLPPPLGSPTLPPGMQSLDCEGGASPPELFAACIANARTPRCAPPLAPVALLAGSAGDEPYVCAPPDFDAPGIF